MSSHSPQEGGPLVRVRGLVREYIVGPQHVHAVAGVDLDVERGSFTAVVGVSGSGKSTLLHLIGGLETPTDGAVLVEGRAVHELSSDERARYRRRVVGFVFQQFHLVPSLTAAENVALALTFQGVARHEVGERTARALGRVGLAERADHRPGQLSGGEQQRVAIARAIVHEPPLLLADEPTGNLDRDNATRTLDLLRALHDDIGTTVIMVTHDEEMAARVADRVVRMRDGQVAAIEEPVR